MDKYKDLYQTDDRFQRYVDTCSKAEGRPVEEVLAEKTIQNVGDYYKANPPREEPKVKNDDNNGIGIIECGGC